MDTAAHANSLFGDAGSVEDQVARRLEELSEDAAPEGFLDSVVGKDRALDSRGAKRFKVSDFNQRTREYFERTFEGGGWFMCRADQQRVDYRMMTYRLDFLGLFDWLAFRKGEVIGIQISAKSAIGTHITEMCSRKETTFNRDTKRNNLERWLQEGMRALVVGWEKPGRLWEASVREVTREEIEKADMRRKARK